MHAGDCAPACVYSLPFAPAPPGLTFPIIAEIYYLFLGLLLRAVNQWQAGGRSRELSVCSLSSGVRTAGREREGCCSSVRARMQKLRASCCTAWRTAGRAFLPRPAARAAAACCNCNRHGRVAAGRWAGLLLLPFHRATISDPDPIIMLLPLRPARDQSTRGGIYIYRPRNPFSLGSWRCMHADCRDWWLAMHGLAILLAWISVLVHTYTIWSSSHIMGIWLVYSAKHVARSSGAVPAASAAVVSPQLSSASARSAEDSVLPVRTHAAALTRVLFWCGIVVCMASSYGNDWFSSHVCVHGCFNFSCRVCRYPSDADKHLLARQTGLSRNQVSTLSLQPHAQCGVGAFSSAS